MVEGFYCDEEVAVVCDIILTGSWLTIWTGQDLFFVADCPVLRTIGVWASVGIVVDVGFTIDTENGFAGEGASFDVAVFSLNTKLKFSGSSIVIVAFAAAPLLRLFLPSPGFLSLSG